MKRYIERRLILSESEMVEAISLYLKSRDLPAPGADDTVTVMADSPCATELTVSWVTKDEI